MEGVGPCDHSTLSQYRAAQEAKSMPSEDAVAKFRYSINMDGTGTRHR